MGLDTVEIVMAVEEAFHIELNDSEAEKPHTPRQLIDLVLRKAAHANSDICLTQRSFHLLRRILIQSCSFHRNQIRREPPLRVYYPDHVVQRAFSNFQPNSRWKRPSNW